MRKYGDDAKYSSLDVMCPICGSWHSIYTECSQCARISYRSSYTSSSYKNNDYTRDYNQDYNQDYNEPRNSTSYKAVICSECGKTYNRASFYDLCPFCARSKSKHKTFKPKYSTKKSNNNSNQWVKCKFCGRLYYRPNNGPCPYCTDSNTIYKPEPTSHLVKCPICGRKKHRGKPCSYCNNIIVCPKCGKRYNRKHKGKSVTSCPHCSTVECPKCGKTYNKNFNSSCHYCSSKEKSSTSPTSNSNDGWILGLCIGLIIIFIILGMFL